MLSAWVPRCFRWVDVAEWRGHFASVEPARRKRFRASATTNQVLSHNPEASPVPCSVAERRRRFVAVKPPDEIAPRFRYIGILSAILQRAWLGRGGAASNVLGSTRNGTKLRGLIVSSCLNRPFRALSLTA